MIINAINQKVELIRNNPHFGNPLAKRLIPDKYISEFGVTNLFRVELPCFWRMLYSLTNGDEEKAEVRIIAFVTDIMKRVSDDSIRFMIPRICRIKRVAKLLM